MATVLMPSHLTHACSAIDEWAKLEPSAIPSVSSRAKEQDEQRSFVLPDL